MSSENETILGGIAPQDSTVVRFPAPPTLGDRPTVDHVAIRENVEKPNTYVMSVVWSNNTYMIFGLAQDYSEGVQMAKTRADRLNAPLFDFTRFPDDPSGSAA